MSRSAICNCKGNLSCDPVVGKNNQELKEQYQIASSSWSHNWSLNHPLNFEPALLSPTRQPHDSEAYSSTILFLSWLLARQLDFWAWMPCHLSHFLQLYQLKSGFERASVPSTQVKEFFSPGSQLGSYLSRASWGHNVSNQQLGGFIWVSLPIQCNVHPQHFVNSCHLFNSKAQWKVQYQVFNRRNKTFTNQTKGQTAPKK